MHAKSDSEVTSVDQSWPARSPRRPLYYVQSPSNQDVEKMSYGSSPLASPHHYYHSSPIHHSRESSTSRFSVSLKNPRNLSSWKKLHQSQHDDDDDNDDDADQGSGNNIRLYLCFFLLFVLFFAAFSLILWGASKSYGPKVLVKVRSNSLETCEFTECLACGELRSTFASASSRFCLVPQIQVSASLLNVGIFFHLSMLETVTRVCDYRIIYIYIYRDIVYHVKSPQ